MKDQVLKTFLVAACLIGLIILGRSIEHLPNFTPVAAVAIFSAFYFKNRFLAVLVPLAGMLAADSVIGSGYDARIMAFVYAGLLFPALFGPLFRRNILQRNGFGSGWKLAGFALGSSTIFFIVSNFGEWVFGTLYPFTAEGLLTCYVKAIPFYQYTILGDLAYGFGIFGIAYAVAKAAEIRRFVFAWQRNETTEKTEN